MCDWCATHVQVKTCLAHLCLNTCYTQVYHTVVPHQLLTHLWHTLPQKQAWHTSVTLVGHEKAFSKAQLWHTCSTFTYRCIQGKYSVREHETWFLTIFNRSNMKVNIIYEVSWPGLLVWGINFLCIIKFKFTTLHHFAFFIWT